MLERIRRFPGRLVFAIRAGYSAPTQSGAGWQAASKAHWRLVMAWLGLALLAFAVAAAFGLALLVLRLPGIGGEAAPALLRASLVLHALLATTVWFLALASAVWVLAAGGGRYSFRWTIWGVAAAGVASLALTPIAQPGPALFANYAPVIDSPLFFAGLLAVVVASALCALDYLRPRRGLVAQLVMQPAPQAATAAALCALAAAVSAALPIVALHGRRVVGYAELVSWGGGHLVQFAFALLLVAAWCVLVPAALPGRNGRRGLGVLLAIQTLVAIGGLGLHVFSIDSPEYRKGFTWLMSVGAWIAPLPLGLWLLATFGRWRATVDAPTALGVTLSALLFVIGCSLGILIRADNVMVAAHYHGTVGGVTLASMLLIYHWLHRWGAPVASKRVTGAIFGLSGGGMLVSIAGLAGAGAMGWPRDLVSVPFAELNGEMLAATVVSGFGTTLAMLGAVMFAWLALRGLRKAVTPEALLEPTIATEPAPARFRDRRLQAAGLLISAILLLGSLLSALPRNTDGVSLSGWFAALPTIDRVSLAADERRKEIAQRFEQGVAMLQAGRYEFAMTAFHQVLKLDSRLVEAHVNLGFALIGIKEFAAARDFFESALVLRPSQHNAYYGIAVASEELGDLEYALGAMRAYTHLAPEGDPYRQKADSAIWEWETQLAANRAKGSLTAQPSEVAKPQAAAGKLKK